MDFFSSLEISASALTAERTRMNLISSNMANANSTRTSEGGPYKRKDAVFTAEQPRSPSFGETLNRFGAAAPVGVQVTEIIEDQSAPRLQFDPKHPDADEKGFVALPNVSIIEEMADMITASRAYEANITAAQAAKSMAMKTLELGR
jgi:flagellar basal-body rod protein FlgC